MQNVYLSLMRGIYIYALWRHIHTRVMRFRDKHACVERTAVRFCLCVCCRRCCCADRLNPRREIDYCRTRMRFVVTKHRDIKIFGHKILNSVARRRARRLAENARACDRCAGGLMVIRLVGSVGSRLASHRKTRARLRWRWLALFDCGDTLFDLHGWLHRVLGNICKTYHQRRICLESFDFSFGFMILSLIFPFSKKKTSIPMFVICW